MASSPADDLFDQFLERRGHGTTKTWIRDQNKKKCPVCGGLHDLDATRCTVCDWESSTQ